MEALVKTVGSMFALLSAMLTAFFVALIVGAMLNIVVCGVVWHYLLRLFGSS